MIIGYIRVSTEEQNDGRQCEALREYGVDRWYTDKKSGKNTERQGLNDMLEFMRDGDVIVTESISRIARSTKDLLNIIERINKKNAVFVSLKENIDTSTPQGKFMLTVFGAMAELERESILQRQREGIALAKTEGKYKGRQPISIDNTQFKAVCARWRSGEITARKAMDELRLRPNTFYRRVKEMGL